MAIVEDREREERGPKTPGLNLASAIELLGRVRDGIGFGRAGRETVAQAIGYSSLNGTSKRAIAALSHFGLMERSGSAALVISELGKRILVPKDPGERTSAIAEAARQPALYQKLFERFGGHGLPGLLANILVREFGILPASSEDVARIFRESVDFAGLLRNGVLHSELDDSRPITAFDAEEVEAPSAATDSGREAERITPRATENSGSVAVPSGSQRYTIPLDKHGRLATIDIPIPVSSSDLRRIGRWAEFMTDMSEEES
jgi:hypothetical protein